MGFSRQEYWSGVPLPSPILTLQRRNSQKSESPPVLWAWNHTRWLIKSIPPASADPEHFHNHVSSKQLLTWTVRSLPELFSRNLELQLHLVQLSPVKWIGQRPSSWTPAEAGSLVTSVQTVISNLFPITVHQQDNVGLVRWPSNSHSWVLSLHASICRSSPIYWHTRHLTAHIKHWSAGTLLKNHLISASMSLCILFGCLIAVALRLFICCRLSSRKISTLLTIPKPLTVKT